MTLKVMVTGAGGFIGGHLVADLLERGEQVIAVDVKPKSQWWQWHPDAQNHPHCNVAMADSDEPSSRMWFISLLAQCGDVYHLAENMGGIGFIETHRVDCLSSVVASVNLLNALTPGQHRLFFSSSACAYNTSHQNTVSTEEITALSEHMAWPANPEEGYGLQKLYVEKLCQWHATERGLSVRVSRFHNSYGPHGSWNDGREKAPAALCRKIATAAITGEKSIEVWGDGRQLRSFMWIGDNIIGIRFIMQSGYDQPVNLGSSELVSVDNLITTIEETAGIRVIRRYDESKPRGVPGRNSDNTLLCRIADGFEPGTDLREGISKLYPWIYDRVKETL